MNKERDEGGQNPHRKGLKYKSKAKYKKSSAGNDELEVRGGKIDE